MPIDQQEPLEAYVEPKWLTIELSKAEHAHMERIDLIEILHKKWAYEETRLFYEHRAAKGRATDLEAAVDRAMAVDHV